jgi:hypothetical protein
MDDSHIAPNLKFHYCSRNSAFEILRKSRFHAGGLFLDRFDEILGKIAGGPAALTLIVPGISAEAASRAGSRTMPLTSSRLT